jgi:type IV fimbrial biogenesis protein FimT
MRQLPAALPGQGGFTLVELMISLLVISVVSVLGAPSFFEYLQNTQTRTATEAVLNGIQVARSEAIQRNKNVRIVFVPPSTGWTVSDDAVGTVIQTRSGAEGTANASLAVLPATTTTITFGALGSVTTNLDTSAPITQLDVSNTRLTTGASRVLRIMVTGGGSIRMCDPAASLATTDPRRC